MGKDEVVRSGVSLFFYKDKDGTPNVLFKWGEKADELMGGNGFSNIQMRVVLEQHLKSNTPKYIKLIILELIQQLNFASKDADRVLKETTKANSSKQQLNKILREQTK